MLYGVIDIGSNTIRLMIYRLERGTLQPVLNNKYAAGLAGYITDKGKLGKDGMQKAVEILKELRTVTEQISLDGIFPFATASLRNISNTKEVLAVLLAETGWAVRVLSGEEEAKFDYYGALQSTAMDTGLLVDVGGGSTELVYFQKRKERAAVSVPVGSLNLYTKYVDGILPSRWEIRKIQQEVARQLDDVHLSLDHSGPLRLCGVGGTARAAQKVYRSLMKPENDQSYDTGFFDDYLSQLEMGPQKLTRCILKTAPDRIHTLTPGIAVLSTVARTFGADTVVTSPYGVREGYVHRVLKEKGIL